MRSQARPEQFSGWGSSWLREGGLSEPGGHVFQSKLPVPHSLVQHIVGVF